MELRPPIPLWRRSSPVCNKVGEWPDRGTCWARIVVNMRIGWRSRWS